MLIGGLCCGKPVFNYRVAGTSCGDGLCDLLIDFMAPSTGLLAVSLL